MFLFTDPFLGMLDAIWNVYPLYLTIVLMELIILGLPLCCAVSDNHIAGGLLLIPPMLLFNAVLHFAEWIMYYMFFHIVDILIY